AVTRDAAARVVRKNVSSTAHKVARARPMALRTESPHAASGASAASSPRPPIRPAPDGGAVHRRFLRGRERPHGVAWFGIRSFWGHLQHLIASAIATEDTDSRDWMTPDDPTVLLDRVARQLGAALPGRTLTERLG